MRDVFPVLRKMCQENGVEFEVVDMRWGVTDAAMTQHLTAAICRQEIANCQRLSLGPTFIVSKYSMSTPLLLFNECCV